MSLAIYAGKAVMNVDPKVRKPAVNQYRNKIPNHEVLIVRFKTLSKIVSCLLYLLFGLERRYFLLSMLLIEKIVLRAPLKTRVPQMHSQIFRQIAQKVRRHTGVCQEAFCVI